MIVLPIAERELRVAARSPRTYWSRSLVALVVTIVALLIYNAYGALGNSKVGGQQLFSALAYLALVYALFAGSALTADCLSSEKREETLGFLFLTDLKGYDVVFGKLVATSLRSIYGLLATFPILSLPLLLGGVQAWEFWRVVLVILNTLLLSLSVGLLVSTLFQRQRVTTHLAAGLMLLVALVPVGLSLILSAIFGGTIAGIDPNLLSPAYALYTAFDRAYKLGSVIGASFWAAVLVQFIFGVLLLVKASLLLPNTWQPSSAKTGPPAREQPGQPEREDEELRTQRRQMLDQNPFYWLAGRGNAIRWGMIAVISLVGAWGISARDTREDFAAAQGVGILLVALVARLLIAVSAAQRLAEDKQSGALDLIITTPLTVEEILDGQWRAIWNKLGWPLLGSLILYAFLIFGGESHASSADQETKVVWFTAACFFILTVADSVALGWLGMWTGLQIRQVPHGAALCLSKIVFPPAILVAGFVWNHGVTSADEYLRTNPYWVPALWLVAGLATDAGWGFWARHKLFHEFRLAATDRFQKTGHPARRWRL